MGAPLEDEFLSEQGVWTAVALLSRVGPAIALGAQPCVSSTCKERSECVRIAGSVTPGGLSKI